MTFKDVLKARKTDNAALTEASLSMVEQPCFALLTTWNLFDTDESNRVTFGLLRYRLDNTSVRYSVLHAIMVNASTHESSVIPFLMVKDIPYKTFQKILSLNAQAMGVYRSLAKIQYTIGSTVETLAEGQVFCYYAKSGALKILGDYRPLRIAQEFGKVFGAHVTFNYPAHTWRERILEFFNRR
jgi:hypothetical protein